MAKKIGVLETTTKLGKKLCDSFGRKFCDLGMRPGRNGRCFGEMFVRD